MNSAHTYIHTNTYILYCRSQIEFRAAYIHKYIHTYIHAQKYKYTHIHVHAYIQTTEYIHTYIHTYVHTCTHIYTHTNTYIHTYIINTYINTYIHTYECSNKSDLYCHTGRPSYQAVLLVRFYGVHGEYHSSLPSQQAT